MYDTGLVALVAALDTTWIRPVRDCRGGDAAFHAYVLDFLKIFFGRNKKVSNKPQKSAGWPQKL